eukprot:g23995.t1
MDGTQPAKASARTMETELDEVTAAPEKELDKDPEATLQSETELDEVTAALEKELDGGVMDKQPEAPARTMETELDEVADDLQTELERKVLKRMTLSMKAASWKIRMASASTSGRSIMPPVVAEAVPCAEKGIALKGVTRPACPRLRRVPCASVGGS